MFRWFLGLNRHLRTAILIAPILTIFGYGLTDLWIKPKTVEQAVQKVNFRPLTLHEGQCNLNNKCRLLADPLVLELDQHPAGGNDLYRINIRSSEHLRGLQIALLNGDQEIPLAAQTTDKTDYWYVEFPRNLWSDNPMILRFAAAQTKKIFTAEFSAHL